MTTGLSLKRWLYLRGRGAVVCRFTSSYTDRPFIGMYEEVDHETRLSIMVDHYCPLLKTLTLITEDITVDINLCCTYFRFDRA